MLQVVAAVMAAAGVLLAALAAGVWRRRHDPAGLSLAGLLLAVAWWGVAYAVELQADDLLDRQRWGDAKYAGVNGLAYAWLVFVLQYTGRAGLLTRRRLALLAVEPVAVLVVLAVPRTHDLVRTYAPGAPGELPLVETGPVFWLHFTYTNIVLVVATGLFVLTMARLARVYWRLAAVLVAAALLPWTFNLLHNFAVDPFTRLDLTPFAFVVTGGVLVWGLDRQRLVDLRPVARSAIVESMADAVLVLDAYGRLADANPAATALLGRSVPAVAGRPLAELLPQPTVHEPGGELTLAVDGQPRTFDVRRQPLADRGRTAGELLVLRDVTERTDAEARLRALLAERSRVAAALQCSLVPGALPRVPGLAHAARYAPAGDGREIGGDFYDLFPLGAQGWAVVLGDVSGKGAEAAAVTARIRYTLRAYAEAGRPPSAVLRAANEVLLRDSADERYATVAYAVVERDGDGWDGALCLAGHHRPLLRRRGGRVEPVGEPGTALGLLDEPELVDAGLRMRPEDVLCLFTDGLVEARHGRDLFGEERAAAVLGASCPDRLDDVAQRVEAAARHFAGGSLGDDLALLLLRADAAG